MTYSLGNVKPWVRDAANDIGPRFGIRTVYGYSHRNIAGTTTLSDHAVGLALDFMCDIPTGDKLAAYVQANAAHYGVTYIIHNRRIWSVARKSEGWRKYTGVNPHTDHVHVSFANHAGSGKANASQSGYFPLPIPGGGLVPVPVPGGGGIPNPLSPAKDTYEAMKTLAKFAAFLANPHSWIRVAMFMVGMWLLVAGLALLMKDTAAADALKSTARTAAKSAARTSTKAVQNAG